MEGKFSPTWEDVEAWDEGTPPRVRSLAMQYLDLQREVMGDRPDGGPSCIVYDEDMAQSTVEANDGLPFTDTILNDTDAYARQGDKGPYHWAQGPLDLTPVTTPAPPETPPVVPSTNPHPATPGTLPKKGKAITTTNLRLRVSAGAGSKSRGVMPTGTEVRLTGGRKRTDNALWVRVQVDSSELVQKRLNDPDVWLQAPPKQYGWVNSEYLAVPASEYVANDFPPITHEFRWSLEDAGGLNAEDVRRTLTAIGDDPRGPLRAGVRLVEASDPATAHVLLRFVDEACGGAAGCYYKKANEKARVDIQKKWFNTMWLSRVFLHETFGHGATRCYDHYNGAPQYPRSDYYGLMGNWQDQYGDHAWPDQDDIDNMVEWKQGQSSLVFLRDTSGG